MADDELAGSMQGVQLNTPTRTSARNVQRINYADMSRGSGDDTNNSGDKDSALFRTPTASTRGRKRRAVVDDSISSPPSTPLTASASRRGRPRGAGVGSRGGRGGVRRAAGDHPLDDIPEQGLLAAVKSGRNIDATIDDWIRTYNDVDPDNALVQLHQFFISCCGCKGVINVHMINTMEYSEIIRRMTEDFDEDSGDYPLVMTGTQWKKFRANLHTFLTRIIDKCKSSVIFDQRMMDSVIQLLTGLADSQVRAFRHTATFIAMKISSALVDVTIELAHRKERNTKQIEAEKARVKQSSGTNERLDVLIQNKNEIEERTDDVRQMLQYIFKSVFVHNYRDVLPDVRSICITELGNWMHVYPEHFLEDSYLKYIGWTLYDKVADVRLKCVHTLLPLYEKVDMLGKLELFTSKFKDRLVSMVLDKDNEVAMKTCQLMTNVYRVFPTILTPADCVPIYELVYCNNRGMAVAAGEFLNTKVFAASKELNLSTSSRSAIAMDRATAIKDLIQFFIEGECHDHASYLVDALIDTNPIVKDWQTMVDLLLSNESDSMEAQLVELLVSAVKQAATGEVPIGRATTKRGAPSTKESRQIADDRTRISEVLIPATPLLLQKFIVDRDKVASLVTLPLYFQLDMYMAGRLENNLADLMRVIDMIVEKHTDEEILNSVAEVITYLSSNTSVAQQTETYQLKLIDGLALQLRHTIQRYQNEEQWDEEDEAAMISSFRKITTFASHIDLRKWDLWEVVLHVIVNQDEKLPRDVVDKSISFLYMQLSWDLARAMKEESNKSDTLKKLKKRCNQYVHQLSIILTEGASGVEVAFLCLTDLLILFSPVLKERYPNLENLVIHLDSDYKDKIKMFVSDNVFVKEAGDVTLDQQQHVELMHKKRSLLAQYCKLIMHGIFGVEFAAVVLKQYLEFYSDFGDIIKQLLVRCRDLDIVMCARAVTLSLTDSYEAIRFTSGVDAVDPMMEQFQSLRDLAKRFAISFGNDHIRNREALAMIHRDGIQYAIKDFDPSARKVAAPRNISFLEVLMEFSTKLIKQDKAVILAYLDKHVGTAPHLKEGNWEAYLLYKATLQEKDRLDDASSMRSFSTVNTSTRGGRGRGRGGRGRGTPTPSEFD